MRWLDGRPDHTINQLVQDLRLLHRIRVGSLRSSSLEVINALKGGLSHALAEVNGHLRLLFGGKA